MNVPIFVDYYQDIIPDINGLLSCLHKPLPTCLWVNTLKITPHALVLLLGDLGYRLEPLPWCLGAFRCDNAVGIAKTWPFYAGLFQIQEAVSMLPVLLLKPQPDSKVLDLCAAPGNKTAQMCVSMQNQGSVIANDCNFDRMRALGQISKRLGFINFSISIYDGVGYPKIDQYFDYVLVDAPCSCEGTFRKSKTKKITPSRRNSLKLSQTQFALVEKAIHLTKPGGRILYSTCTFAPEENEAVVDRILSKWGDCIRVIPLKMPGFHHAPGIRSWREAIYHPSVMDTMRIWPHFNNTGGFYIALLEKTDAINKHPIHVVSNDKNLADGYYPDQLFQGICDRFDLSHQVLSQFKYLNASNRGIHFTNTENTVPKEINLDSMGLFFLKTRMKYPKLSTAAAMILAKWARRHVIHLQFDQVCDYYQRKDCVLSQDQLYCCDSTGYVFVMYNNNSLGVGLYLAAGRGKMARLRSLYPKYMAGID